MIDLHCHMLRLTSGADAHLTPELLDRLKKGTAPTLNGGRYFLLEPPHHVAPPRFEESVFNFLVTGYVPVITHPERLTWIEDQYEIFTRLAKRGAWMQITAGSVTGRFGSRPKYWAERMLDERLVDILATDAHHIDKRPPLLAEARDAAAARVGSDEAWNMVSVRPRGILEDASPQSLPRRPEMPPQAVRKEGLWQRLVGGR